MRIKKPELIASLAAGTATVALLAGLAYASHVTISSPSSPPGTMSAQVVTPSSDAPVIVVPPTLPGGAPAPAVQAPPPAPLPTTLQVDEIRAQQVRANTIYANRIDADQVQGMLHQNGTVKVRDTKGEIKAPEVTASVIYADSIKANLVVAENIFVRDLKLNR